MGTETMNAGVAVTIAIFCIGVVYQCGRLSARVDSIELWRQQMDKTLNSVHSGIRRIEELIKGEK